MSFVTEMLLSTKEPDFDLSEPPPAYASSYHEAEAGELPPYFSPPDLWRQKPWVSSPRPANEIQPKIINQRQRLNTRAKKQSRLHFFRPFFGPCNGVLCVVWMAIFMILTILGVAIGAPIALALHPPSKGGGGNSYDSWVGR